MIKVEEFREFLEENNVDFYTGVPDSQLKAFCDYIEEEYSTKDKHIIAPNEGNAVALASGHHLSTGKLALVYMQNSGLGNAVNPITSLTHPDVYNIPVIYLIGWRGQPNTKDEPQHKKQGKITTQLLELLDIDYQVLDEDTTIDDVRKVFNKRFAEKLGQGESIAYLVAKNAFNPHPRKHENENTLTREESIQHVVDYLDDEDMIISTTGKTSRELYEYREKLGQGHSNDFLTVGSMGHASTIALAVAKENPDKRILCFDGDGAVLMHMASLAMIGSMKQENYYHIVFNNKAHESVGGLPTIIDDIKLDKIALNCGYKHAYTACNMQQLDTTIPEFLSRTGPSLLIVKVNIESRPDLGRPTTTPTENKKAFMKKLGGK